jgi:hypothetical protein
MAMENHPFIDTSPMEKDMNTSISRDFSIFLHISYNVRPPR